jgi:hypothetical protein
LAVFLINAEMLESRYLIGVKNTFQASEINEGKFIIDETKFA